MSSERARIVSSAHLVSDSAAELSEVEYGLIVASNAFGLWCVRGTAAAIAEFPVAADLGVLDVLCLHSVNHRGREKKLADICFKLNIEDAYTSSQKLKLLQAIHVAHEKMVANENTVNKTEQELATLRLHNKASASDTNMASLKAEREQKAREVLAHFFIHMQPSCLC